MVEEITKVKSGKTGLITLLKVVSFVTVFVLILNLTSTVFVPKQNIHENGINYFNARGFYGEPQDSIDIIAIGNSDLYSGFSPMVLWKNQGYTSYVSGEARQTVHQAYNLVKEVLTCQKPKLIIVETDSIYEEGFTPFTINNTIDAFCKNTFPVVEYHNRWKSLTPEDFTEKPVRTWKSKSKGFGLSNKTDPYTGDEYMIPTSDTEPIRPRSLYYLNKIVETCADNNIPLLFVELPSAKSWNYKRHNAVAAYASKKNVPFLDLNINNDDFNIDWTTDTRDKGSHLNCSGARKVTTFLGDYISKNYKVEDHRSDSMYEEWNRELVDYDQKVLI